MVAATFVYFDTMSYDAANFSFCMNTKHLSFEGKKMCCHQKVKKLHEGSGDEMSTKKNSRFILFQGTEKLLNVHCWKLGWKLL